MTEGMTLKMTFIKYIVVALVGAGIFSLLSYASRRHNPVQVEGHVFRFGWLPVFVLSLGFIFPLGAVMAEGPIRLFFIGFTIFWIFGFADTLFTRLVIKDDVLYYRRLFKNRRIPIKDMIELEYDETGRRFIIEDRYHKKYVIYDFIYGSHALAGYLAKRMEDQPDLWKYKDWTRF